MFYVLNLENNQFISCKRAAAAEETIKKLLEDGIPKECIEIMNGSGQGVRLDIDQFRKLCEAEHLIERESHHESVPAYSVDPNKLQAYIENEMILEFSSEQECMDYLNTYDSQKFTSIDEMKKFQGEYGFGFDGKWYHISYDEAMDVKNDIEGNKRVSALLDYKKNEDVLKRAAEEREQEKVDSLIGKIKELKPRIDELIAVGNACLQSNIPLIGQGVGIHEGYDTNQFFTNSWSHLVGFVGNPHLKDCNIQYLGINGGGACGVYNFRTDGKSVFSVHERNAGEVIAPSIGHMERFLKTFDEFESSFYNYVDKKIENQKKSVDELIGTAQGKNNKQTVQRRENIESER